ncbi:MAG: hypothetical protein K6E33_00815 [Lachnospiraceae bacterium]|nr:hypothetical protein [Lachnospiraceae bacterium]
MDRDSVINTDNNGGGNKHRKKVHPWTSLLMIPVALVLDAVALALAGMADIAMMENAVMMENAAGQTQGGHPFPVVIFLTVIVVVIVTIAVIIASIVLTVIRYRRAKEQEEREDIASG